MGLRALAVRVPSKAAVLGFMCKAFRSWQSFLKGEMGAGQSVQAPGEEACVYFLQSEHPGRESHLEPFSANTRG